MSYVIYEIKKASPAPWRIMRLQWDHPYEALMLGSEDSLNKHYVLLDRINEKM